MYMKVFPHGQGGGGGPTNYLVRPDYPGRDELPPKVLCGDVETTRALIDTLDTKWKFTAGVLSWHPEDEVAPEQEERVMDDFEQVAFAGLNPDQRNILWVRHSHAGHHELHFVIPRVELSSGKAFNPCPPGWQKDFDVFRDLHNHREGWARPDDPTRARIHTPEHADLHNARLLRWGKTPSKDDRAEAKEAVHAFMQTNIEQGLVRNRKDVLQTLVGAGLGINRAGKDYITVKDPDSGEKLRLKGGIYAEQWKLELSGRENAGQSRTGTARDGSTDPAAIRRLEGEFERIIKKRAQYNRSRYPSPTLDIKRERERPLPALKMDVHQAMDTHPSPLHKHPDGYSSGRLGDLDFDRIQGHQPATGDSHTQPSEGLFGKNNHALGGQNLGGAAGGRPGGTFHHFTGERHSETRLDVWQEPCLESGVSHDRTGTHSQGNPDQTGEEFGPYSGKTWNNSGQSTTHSGNPQRDLARSTRLSPTAGDRTAGIGGALAKLEQCIHALETVLVAFERLVKRQIESAKVGQRNRKSGLER